MLLARAMKFVMMKNDLPMLPNVFRSNGQMDVDIVTPFPISFLVGRSNIVALWIF